MILKNEMIDIELYQYKIEWDDSINFPDPYEGQYKY